MGALQSSEIQKKQFDEKTSFVLIGRCQVRPGIGLQTYITTSQLADEDVINTEPGLLHHTFDQEPNDPYAFVWTDVYRDDDSLLFHLKSEAFETICKKNEEMCDDFRLEIYGTISEETKVICDKLSFPVSYYETVFGYSRLNKNKET